ETWRSTVYFFFSSRRRHTRFSRDWSSDVCSSDLREFLARGLCGKPARLARNLRLDAFLEVAELRGRDPRTDAAERGSRAADVAQDRKSVVYGKHVDLTGRRAVAQPTQARWSTRVQ